MMKTDTKGCATINGKRVIVDKEKNKEYFRKYRAENREKWRNYRREYNKKWRKENGYHNEINSKERYPEKENCRKESRRLLKQGKIVKEPCEECGSKKSQMHHTDYTKPSKVRWLCALHHSIEEKRAFEY